MSDNLDETLYEDRTEEEKAQRRRESLVNQSLVAVMMGSAGRRVMYDILARGGIMTSSFNADSPYVTAFNEGCRSLALYIMQKIDEHCPAMYATMLLEAKQETEHERSDTAQPGNPGNAST